MDEITKESISYWKDITNIITSKFCDKQGLLFEYDAWVGFTIGGVICINEMFFNFQDILYDIENEIEKGKIFDWYWWCLENQDNMISYSVWLKSNLALKQQ